MGQAPTGFGHGLCALDLSLGPSLEVAIVGDPASEETRAMVRLVNGDAFRPNLVLAVAAPGDAALTSLPLLKDRVASPGAAATAYVCERFACRLPVTTREALEMELRGGSEVATGWPPS